MIHAEFTCLPVAVNLQDRLGTLTDSHTSLSGDR